MSYILKLVTKPFSNIVDKAGTYTDDNEDEIKFKSNLIVTPTPKLIIGVRIFPMP